MTHDEPATAPDPFGRTPPVDSPAGRSRSRDAGDESDDLTAAPQKDFLALTHGQEWVTFYESFDLVVQDHLSRSSDLLRRAMSLPEVADREVAAERERTNAVLTAVKTQIVNSHRLASTLAMSLGA